ncbi:hypothetical protein SESBI_11563 [Sesbania bispinosa]|nr:hypothetical protein SESBI_11563 [Sesbania bispinosa]
MRNAKKNREQRTIQAKQNTDTWLPENSVETIQDKGRRTLPATTSGGNKGKGKLSTAVARGASVRGQRRVWTRERLGFRKGKKIVNEKLQGEENTFRQPRAAATWGSEVVNGGGTRSKCEGTEESMDEREARV